MRLARDLLPLGALLLGLLGSRWLVPLTPLIPWAIASMLFLTFLGVRPRELRLRRTHLVVLGLELLLVALGLWLYLYQPSLGVPVVLLLITPTATAAPSIVQLLGGQVGFVASSMLLAHTLAVVLAPIVLPLIAPSADVASFAEQALGVLLNIAPLVLLPIALAWCVRWWLPQLSERMLRIRSLPYIIWLSSLVLLMAHTGELLTTYAEAWRWADLLYYLCIGLVVCVGEFALGHLLATPLGVERHALRQSLGQKNTTLALWLATLFLPPLISVVVAGYIVWQNLCITLLMMRRA